jgi:hypothetical protein
LFAVLAWRSRIVSVLLRSRLFGRLLASLLLSLPATLTPCFIVSGTKKAYSL